MQLLTLVNLITDANKDTNADTNTYAYAKAYSKYDVRV